MGTETFHKGGKTAHKSFGTEKGASFVPTDTRTEYRQTGSGTSYPKSGEQHVSGQKASGYKFNREPGSFASGGGSKMVSASYPRKLHQNKFDTTAKNHLGPARTKTAKAV